MSTAPQIVQEASRLWKMGISRQRICEMTGISSGSLDHHARTYRNAFPERYKPWLRETPETEPHQESCETMAWVTHSGAIVTLPKISCLLGKRG